MPVRHMPAPQAEHKAEDKEFGWSAEVREKQFGEAVKAYEAYAKIVFPFFASGRIILAARASGGVLVTGC